MALPYLGVQHEVDGAQQHEHHEHHLDEERVVVHDALAHGSEAAGHEARDGQPERLQDRAQRLHAYEEAHERQDTRRQDDEPHAYLGDELRGLHHVGHDVLAAALRRVQARARAFAEQAERQRHHDEAEAAQQVHHEAPHVVGVGKVVEVEDDAGTRGGDARHAVEQRVEIAGEMTREIQRDACHAREHDPRETGHGQRLLAAEPAGLDAQETQARAEDERDSDGQQVVRGRFPLTACDSRGQRHEQRDGGEEDEHAQIVPDDAYVVEGEPLPHGLSPPKAGVRHGPVARRHPNTTLTTMMSVHNSSRKHTSASSTTPNPISGVVMACRMLCFEVRMPVF